MMKRFITLCMTLVVAAVPTVVAAAEASETSTKIVRVEPVKRELKKNVYAYKGEWLTGLTASYFTFSADNASYLFFVDDIKASFGMTSIKPYGGYFYRDNRAVGLRLGYSFMGGKMDSANIDLGVDSGLSFDVPYINYAGNYYSASVFHRSYTALDRNGHFGLFAEMELAALGGSSIFEYRAGDSGLYTKSDKMAFNLSFNPGMSVFIMDNVSTSVSFEFGGLTYTKIKQYDENGVSTGSRDYSGMSFKFNFLAINFGVNIHIW